jgi:hypothetical protein
MLSNLFRILDNQLEKFDSLQSYGYSSNVGDEIFEDENGRYKKEHIRRQVPCGCHPETCSHFTEKVWESEVRKIYLDE